MVKTFWKQWVDADEIGRIKLIKTLPAFNRGYARFMTATLLNSYLNDLYQEIKGYDT
jgi:hypothetical protein